ncbi:MAG: hypothetical protein Q8O41_10440 [Candidatus Methanoperedens sp.]|nr:hypothetical protein [Candidatus Methanoperedens sp.]
MSAELTRIATTYASSSGWKPYPAHKDAGMGRLGMAPENNAKVIFQTGLTGRQDTFYHLILFILLSCQE